MCLVVWTVKPNNKYDFILIANRDESYHRPTQPAHYWSKEQLIASRDLLHGGTQIALSTSGKLGMVTNLITNDNISELESRGLLVLNYLRSNMTTTAYINQAHTINYKPYNLVIGSIPEILCYTNSTGPKHISLEPHLIYGLGNTQLCTPTDRVIKAKILFQEHIMKDVDDLVTNLFEVLNAKDVFQPRNDFDFGTRTQTVIIKHGDKILFIERSLKLESLQDNNPMGKNVIKIGDYEWIQYRYEI